jgi:hypothetical protein
VAATWWSSSTTRVGRYTANTKESIRKHWLSTIYNYTLSFTMEEQVVFSRPGERSPHYEIGKRISKLDPRVFPILRQSGSVLFDNFDRRYKEGLEMILRGRKERTLDRS